MNVLEFYNAKQIHISEPIEEEDDNYFSKITYNKAPFILKTNKVCYYKPREELHISITSKEYLEWFEKFYHDIMEQFHTVSKEWFEEPLTLRDVECSFIHPLKTNIKDNCFDVLCTMDEERMIVTDTKDNIHSLEDLSDNEVIPTFHIKGIHFNSKHFYLEIELHHLCVLMPETDEICEYVMNTDELIEADVHLDKLSIYNVYEFLNSKIKGSMVDEIKGILSSKKINSTLDFSEVFDDEDME
jgi:hypothetical protein